MAVKPVHAKKFLKSRVLARIIETAQLQGKAQSVLAKLLPDSIAAHITGVVIRNKILIILVSNQTWATKLRYMTPTLKTPIMQALDTTLYSVQIKVAPSTPPPQQSVKPKRKYTVPTEALFQAAMALDDPDLSDVLARIALLGSDHT